MDLTLLEASGSTSDASSYTTGTITPPANSVLLIFLEVHRGSSTNPATPTVTGGSKTYTAQVTPNNYRSSGTIRGTQFCYRSAAGASPGSYTINFAFAATHQNCHWYIVAAEGVETGGTNGGDAIAQQPTDSGTGTSGLVTMSAAGASDNRPVSFFSHFANETQTEEHTEIAEQAHGSPNAVSSLQFKSTAFDTSPTASWTTSANWGGIAVELVAAVLTPSTQNVTPGVGDLGLDSPDPTITSTATPGAPSGWHASGVDAAGFQNVVAWNTTGTYAVGGGDVSGVHVTTDDGATWSPRSRGLDQAGKAVAAIIEHPDIPDQWYMMAGSGSGLWYHTDITDTTGSWSFIRSAIVRAGNWTGNNRGQPTKHPRFTGHYMAWGPSVTPTSRWLYYGTIDDGVFRATDGTGTATRIAFGANTSYFVRAIATDATTLSTLYVGTAYTVSSETAASPTYVAGGLFKITNAHTRGTAAGENERLTTPFDHVWDIAVTANSIIVTGAITTWAQTGGHWLPTYDAGVWRSTNGGTSWSRLGSGTLASTTDWRSVEAYTSGTTDIIKVGASDGRATANEAKSMYRSTNSGSTWTDQTSDTANYTFTVPDGTTWWLKTSLGGSTYPYPYGSTYVASMRATNPTNRAKELVSGRSGYWRTANATSSPVSWRVSVKGLCATINPVIMADPTDPDRIFAANVDWNWFNSVNRMEKVTSRDPGAEATYGMAPDESTTPSGWLLGTGSRDSNATGKVWYSANPVTTAWTADTWPTATERPFGMVSKLINNVLQVFAGSAGGGIRKRTSGTWGSSSSAAIPNGDPGYKHAEFTWPTNNHIFFIDPQTGVWRNLAANVSNIWEQVWVKTSTARGTFFITSKPNDSSTVWASVADGLYRIDGANGASPSVTKLTGGPGSNVGPIRFDPTGTTLFAFQRGTAPTMWTTTNPESNTPTWTDVGDAFIRQIGPTALDMAVTRDRVYLAMDGIGIIVADLTTTQGVFPDDLADIGLSAYAPEVAAATTNVEPEAGGLSLDAFRPNVNQPPNQVLQTTSVADIGLSAYDPSWTQTPPDTSTEEGEDDNTSEPGRWHRPKRERDAQIQYGNVLR